jgi:hypothetical protein
MRKFFLILFLFPIITFSQDKPLKISAWLDVYYGYDFLKPNNNNRAGFLYNHTRHNEVNLNLAFLKANYETDKVKANIALGTGTYMQYNYAAEPTILQNIYEANVGIKLAKNTWLEAGVLPSHIGFEGAISKDCWALSRSLLAENSPYFETGVKLTHTPNEKLTLAALFLNGWQRIKRVEANSTPTFGTQIMYQPNKKITFNWSTFIGNDKPDSMRQMRYFNDFYAIFEITPTFGMITGFDIGLEQKSFKNTQMNVWYSPIVIARLKATQKWTLAARGELYKDAKGVIISTEIPDFHLIGFSLNADYQVIENVIWRMEARNLKSNGNAFSSNRGLENSNFSILTSLAISF